MTTGTHDISQATGSIYGDMRTDKGSEKSKRRFNLDFRPVLPRFANMKTTNIYINDEASVQEYVEDREYFESEDLAKFNPVYPGK